MTESLTRDGILNIFNYILESLKSYLLNCNYNYIETVRQYVEYLSQPENNCLNINSFIENNQLYKFEFKVNNILLSFDKFNMSVTVSSCKTFVTILNNCSEMLNDIDLPELIVNYNVANIKLYFNNSFNKIIKKYRELSSLLDNLISNNDITNYKSFLQNVVSLSLSDCSIPKTFYIINSSLSIQTYDFNEDFTKVLICKIPIPKLVSKFICDTPENNINIPLLCSPCLNYRINNDCYIVSLSHYNNHCYSHNNSYNNMLFYNGIDYVSNGIVLDLSLNNNVIESYTSINTNKKLIYRHCDKCLSIMNNDDILPFSETFNKLEINNLNNKFIIDYLYDLSDFNLSIEIGNIFRIIDLKNNTIKNSITQYYNLTYSVNGTKKVSLNVIDTQNVFNIIETSNKSLNIIIDLSNVIIRNSIEENIIYCFSNDYTSMLILYDYSDSINSNIMLSFTENFISIEESNYLMKLDIFSNDNDLIETLLYNDSLLQDISNDNILYYNDSSLNLIKTFNINTSAINIIISDTSYNVINNDCNNTFNNYYFNENISLIIFDVSNYDTSYNVSNINNNIFKTSYGENNIYIKNNNYMFYLELDYLELCNENFIINYNNIEHIQINNKNYFFSNTPMSLSIETFDNILITNIISLENIYHSITFDNYHVSHDLSGNYNMSVNNNILVITYDISGLLQRLTVDMSLCNVINSDRLIINSIGRTIVNRDITDYLVLKDTSFNFINNQFYCTHKHLIDFSNNNYIQYTNIYRPPIKLYNSISKTETIYYNFNSCKHTLIFNTVTKKFIHNYDNTKCSHKHVYDFINCEQYYLQDNSDYFIWYDSNTCSHDDEIYDFEKYYTDTYIVEPCKKDLCETLLLINNHKITDVLDIDSDVDLVINDIPLTFNNNLLLTEDIIIFKKNVDKYIFKTYYGNYKLINNNNITVSIPDIEYLIFLLNAFLEIDNIFTEIISEFRNLLIADYGSNSDIQIINLTINDLIGNVIKTRLVTIINKLLNRFPEPIVLQYMDFNNKVEPYAYIHVPNVTCFNSDNKIAITIKQHLTIIETASLSMAHYKFLEYCNGIIDGIRVLKTVINNNIKNVKNLSLKQYNQTI